MHRWSTNFQEVYRKLKGTSTSKVERREAAEKRGRKRKKSGVWAYRRRMKRGENKAELISALSSEGEERLRREVTLQALGE